MAILHQEWPLKGMQNKKNKDEKFVDIVVQTSHQFVGIEVHGSKEHYVDVNVMEADQKKLALWRYRMPKCGEIVVIDMPEHPHMSMLDGSWHAHVAARIQKAVL